MMAEMVPALHEVQQHFMLFKFQLPEVVYIDQQAILYMKGNKRPVFLWSESIKIEK